jgi:hypothetical protein
MARLRALAKDRKTKREEKRATLPWSGKEKRPRSGSMYKWWAARLDSLWGRVVRARDKFFYGNVCRIRKAKNCTGKAEVGYHLVSKARGHAIRWNLDAGVAACARCNDGERLNRVLYDEYHQELFGADFITTLKVLARQTLKVDPSIMKDMAAEFLRIEAYYLQKKISQGLQGPSGKTTAASSSDAGAGATARD